MSIKKLSFIGAGYVGLSNAIGFANLGYKTIIVDISKYKIDKLNRGYSPIYEKDIEFFLKKALKEKKIQATTNLEYAIKNSDVTFICVQTPSKKNDKINLNYIKRASREIGKYIKNKNWHLIVVKSTVIPSTSEKIIIPIIEKTSHKKIGKSFGLCMNPEFLSEGNAIYNFFYPDRIVIGEYNKKSGDELENIYSVLGKKIPILRSDLKTAEMIKYASNSFIGTKISFANEIGNICKKIKIDGKKVMVAVSLDHRFSRYFMRPGLGFGGPCLEKDINALINFTEKINYKPEILKSVIKMNKKQIKNLLSIVEKKMREKKSKKIGILGVSFKDSVKDIRNSSAIEIIDKLIKKDATIFFFDPLAKKEIKKIYPQITYKKNIKKLIECSDIILILNNFKKIDNLSYKNKTVIDTKGLLSKNKYDGYNGLCW